MSGRLRAMPAALLASALALAGCATGPPMADEPPAAPGARELRVCADPNNMPFSNEREEGFENALAQLVAREMGATVRYTWWAQRRGFIRNTLRALECDVVMGVPTAYELVLPTRPYYRSTYVFLYRRDGGIEIETLDDPILRELKIGVHLIGDDYANPPPAHALSNRGIVRNVIGYSIYGDYGRPDPPARLVEAVAAGEIDIAIVWGPLGGYFAPRQAVALEMAPVRPEIELPFLPMVFDISMGVRRDDLALKDELDAILERRTPEIVALLDAYRVPLVGRPMAPASPSAGVKASDITR